MRSEIAKKIISETPPEVKEKVKKYADEVVRRHQEVEAIELTDEEKEDALFEGRKAKYFRLKNADKWPEEVEKVKTKSVVSPMKND